MHWEHFETVRSIQPGLKPTTPMHGPTGPHLKPATPMRAPNRSKQAHPRPQRRHRFHEPRQPRPQRRRGFHERPKNTTGSTTARPHPDPLETRDTNARPQRPKTGPSTTAKATPVSCASRHHCHREPSAARSYLSLTGSLAPICESQSMFHACFTRTDRIPTPLPQRTWPAPLNSAKRHPLAPQQHPHSTILTPQIMRP